MFTKKIFVFSLALLFLTACGDSLPGVQKKIPANNQFRLHEIVWDIHIADGWKRMSKPLDETMDMPFFATDTVQNMVILPGSRFEEGLIKKYIQNGEEKFFGFELLQETTDTLKFKGALVEDADVSIFDQRVFRWDGSDDLFLIYSCNYPENFDGEDQCGEIFATIRKSN